MLTPERETEIRTRLVTEGRTFGVKGTQDLLAEIDVLRAKVAALKEAGDGLEHEARMYGHGATHKCARWREVRGRE